MAWSEATGSASASELHALIILESVGSGGSMSRAPSEQGSLMAWILGVSALAGVLVSLGSYFAVAGWMSDESMRGSAELPIAVFIPTSRTLWWVVGGGISGMLGGLCFSLIAKVWALRQGRQVSLRALAIVFQLFAILGVAGGVAYYRFVIRGVAQHKAAEARPDAAVTEQDRSRAEALKERGRRRGEARTLMSGIVPGSVAFDLELADSIDADFTGMHLADTVIPRLYDIGWDRLTEQDRQFLDDYSEKRLDASRSRSTRRFRAFVIARSHGMSAIEQSLAVCEDVGMAQDGGHDTCRDEVARFVVDACMTQDDCRHAGYDGDIAGLADLLLGNAVFLCTRTAKRSSSVCEGVRARLESH